MRSDMKEWFFLPEGYEASLSVEKCQCGCKGNQEMIRSSEYFGGMNGRRCFIVQSCL